MVKYIGNTSNIVNWDEIIKICSEVEGDRRTPIDIYDRVLSDTNNVKLSEYKEVFTKWVCAGYKIPQIEWHDYFPEEHFDILVRDKIAEFLNARPCRVFISKVLPGKIVPWHYDIDDEEEKFLKDGYLKRYTIFIQKPQIGHVLPLEKHCFHMMPQGDVWEWDSYRNWHAGINLSFEPHFLFHFLGILND